MVAQAYDSIADRTNSRNCSVSLFQVSVAPLLLKYSFLLAKSYYANSKEKEKRVRAFRQGQQTSYNTTKDELRSLKATKSNSWILARTLD